MPAPVTNDGKQSEEPKKLKPCCSCPDTKKVRDQCIIENGEENCGKLIEAHKNSKMQKARNKYGVQANILHQEILRLDTMAKQHIQMIGSSVRSEKDLLELTRTVKDILEKVRKKIDSLSVMSIQMSTRAETVELNSNVARHNKELEDNHKQLRNAAVNARKIIAVTERSALFDDVSEDLERRNRLNTQIADKEDTQKTTQRLSSLVSRMGERVAQSESTMNSLVHSSAVLARTQGEFEDQAAQIQTGGKLLSKYERRELTDKILLIIAFIFYLAVIYYICHKRILARFWLW